MSQQETGFLVRPQTGPRSLGGGHAGQAYPIQIFTRITLPLMQPYIVLVLILRLIAGFRVFDKIFVISGGGPNRASETLNLMIYQEAFGALNYGYASALGVVMLAVIFIISLGIFRYRERDWSY
ncbi:MAG: sugar ABC transporter permease [Candidatus Adiutricales bacterium]